MGHANDCQKATQTAGQRDRETYMLDWTSLGSSEPQCRENTWRFSLRTLADSIKLDVLKNKHELGNEYLGCLSHHGVRRIRTVTFLAHIFLLRLFLSFVPETDVLPFGCVVSWNKNHKHPKLSMYNPHRHQYIILQPRILVQPSIDALQTNLMITS